MMTNRRVQLIVQLISIYAVSGAVHARKKTRRNFELPILVREVGHGTKQDDHWLGVLEMILRVIGTLRGNVHGGLH